MKKIVVYAIVLIPVVLLAQTSSPNTGKKRVDLLWKARAFQAIERIKEFSDNPPEPLTKKIRYEMSFEVAYANFLQLPETLIKKSPHNTSYHIVFNLGGLLDVLYTYNNESEMLVSVGIDRLPKGTRVVIPSGAAKNTFLSNYIIVSDINEPDNPSILFSLTDPFSSFIFSESNPSGQQPVAEPNAFDLLKQSFTGDAKTEPNLPDEINTVDSEDSRLPESPKLKAEEIIFTGRREPEAVTKFFQTGPKCGSSPDFAIQLQSTVEPSRWDHVITVHGFVNDGEICQMLVDYLNGSTNSVYRAVQINN